MASPPVKNALPGRKEAPPPEKETAPPVKETTPPKNETPPPKTEMLPPKKEAPPKNDLRQPKKLDPSAEVLPPPIETSPPKTIASMTSPPKTIAPITSPPKNIAPKTSPPKTIAPITSPPKTINPVTSFPKSITPITSPPLSALKVKRTDSKVEENIKPATKEPPAKPERRVVTNVVEAVPSTGREDNGAGPRGEPDGGNATKDDDALKGVGDKIKKFEKAAEDASVGRFSRPGSVRGRPRTERLGSDGKEDFPPPATPFRDNIHFDLAPDKSTIALERQQSVKKSNVKWQRSESNSESEKTVFKPEPQKIIKPEFKPFAAPADFTIRSPSLGGKIPEQFPSQGTAFRNVASPDTNRNREPIKAHDDFNAQGDLKSCKPKNKEKYSVSKGSSYFTRGSEEIWLVKKKDIEAIEERVFDSFRRAGGNACMRSESVRPASDGGHATAGHATMGHATTGRGKRGLYLRSESLDPQCPPGRAHTLKRQSSVACTCGHDNKSPRAKSAGAEPAPARARSRSHADDHHHVLDKYETLV